MKANPLFIIAVTSCLTYLGCSLDNPPECFEGKATKCVNDDEKNVGMFYTCENGHWTDLPKTCKDSFNNDISCADDFKCPDLCENGTTRCENDENKHGTAYTCVNGLWKDATSCVDDSRNPTGC